LVVCLQRSLSKGFHTAVPTRHNTQFDASFACRKMQADFCGFQGFPQFMTRILSPQHQHFWGSFHVAFDKLRQKLQ
jgi:hypothetical protein